MKQPFPWTAEDINKVMTMYASSTLKGIAEAIGHGCKTNDVLYLVNLIRKNGGNLPKKGRGKILSLVRQVLGVKPN